ncbi:hypothetical protein [Exiguobacterium acetylicum]|uniref:hypothetical protein n=1 Tax=Exiguobacterium acetylicum TaxID=41170 RepID=UPI001EE193BE|nr:hypothetical protein [Exiguobacterium acetylicum]UKS55880.1 hypothetical protein K6T22_15345 [Exiguobacterium acetylicum]
MPQVLIGILGILGIVLLAHHIIMYWHAEPTDRPSLAYRIALLIACLLLISGSDHLISIFYADSLAEFGQRITYIVFIGGALGFAWYFRKKMEQAPTEMTPVGNEAGLT